LGSVIESSRVSRDRSQAARADRDLLVPRL
jgi:hypothetical protein